IDENQDAETGDTRVVGGDILLNITGASLGRTCLVPSPFGPANVNQHVCIVRVSDTQLREFVSLAMKSSATKGHIDAVQNGAAREGLNFQQVAALKLACPPATEASLIVEYVQRSTEKIDQLVETASKAIVLLTERRSALISAAVTGKID